MFAAAPLMSIVPPRRSSVLLVEHKTDSNDHLPAWLNDIEVRDDQNRMRAPCRDTARKVRFFLRLSTPARQLRKARGQEPRACAPRCVTLPDEWWYWSAQLLGCHGRAIASCSTG